MSYQGWANYETWAVHLWLSNEEGSYYEARRICRRDGGEAAQALKEYVEEGEPDLGGTLWGDLLGAALSEVDWYEVAEGFKDEEDEE